MRDYSGPLQEDFSWDQLDKKTLARFGREVMLCNQIHDRTVMPLIGERWGMRAITSIAIDEWMSASPNYNARIRAMHNIDGDGVEVIFKGFQLDIGAPHMWLKFHYDLHSHDKGFFWLTFCGAYHHVRAMTNGDQSLEEQICIHMEDPTFDATVMAVNRGARCHAVYRPPHPAAEDIPTAGPCKWEVSIDKDMIGTVSENDLTAVVRDSRAAQFLFSNSPPALDGDKNDPRNDPDNDGMADYSGEFKRDFCLEDLCHSKLIEQVKEFALDVHLLQRGCYLSVQKSHGEEVIADLISEHWAAMAPVYQARMRSLFNIEGDSMTAILKLLQLDHHFVPEYVKTGVQLINEKQGLFWIEDCQAIDDGPINGVLTGLWQGQIQGLEQVVKAVNPHAQLRAVTPDTVKNSPPGRQIRFAYTIDIEPDSTAQPRSIYSDLAAANGLAELDLSEHIYQY